MNNKQFSFIKEAMNEILELNKYNDFIRFGVSIYFFENGKYSLTSSLVNIKNKSSKYVSLMFKHNKKGKEEYIKMLLDEARKLSDKTPEQVKQEKIQFLENELKGLKEQ